MNKNTLPPEIEARFDEEFAVAPSYGFRKAPSPDELKQFIADELQAHDDRIRRETVERIYNEIKEWHSDVEKVNKETFGELPPDRYTKDYAGGILRGYTLFGRYLARYLDQLSDKQEV